MCFEPANVLFRGLIGSLEEKRCPPMLPTVLLFSLAFKQSLAAVENGGAGGGGVHNYDENRKLQPETKFRQIWRDVYYAVIRWDGRPRVYRSRSNIPFKIGRRKLKKRYGSSHGQNIGYFRSLELLLRIIESYWQFQR